MRICVDKNHLLVIENENIPKVKEFSQIVWGYVFSDFDKGILVRHKKQIKIVNLKNLGDGMAVFYIKPEKDMVYWALDKPSFVAWLCNFSAFDEEQGNTYFFIPKFRDDDLAHINKILKKLGIDVSLEKTVKWTCVVWNIEKPAPNSRCDFVSQIFAFVLLYGKLDIKNPANRDSRAGAELVSFKFHLPLFGVYLMQKEYLDRAIDELKAQWFFLKKDILVSKDGIIYQVSCNDYELLQAFAKIYEPIEKITKIPKYEQNLEAKKALLEFVKNDKQVPMDWKEEVINAIERRTVKLLVK